ncbi:MAG TPA: DUF899 family protein [Acetobacteraceae bacterium]|nr:DUF899 family protein [Acetobacteraceae bacterium]
MAKPRHRDASKRERRRIVAQGDPVQRAEGITRGETFPWASSLGGDFNASITGSDSAIETSNTTIGATPPAMGATTVPEPVVQNAAMTGADVAAYTRERPGMSAFVVEDGVAYHTYSTYARGLDGLWGHVPVARPRPQGAQRDGRLVAPPRHVRQALSQVVGAAVR